MKNLLIYNSNSIDSVLCKHITMALFPDAINYEYYDIGKSEKFYLPDADQTIEYDKFIFIGTYPNLTWFDAVLSTPNNSKQILVYATYNNTDYQFNNDFAKLVQSYSDIISEYYMRDNFQHISSQNIIIQNQQPYNNRETIFNKIDSCLKNFTSKTQYHNMVKLFGAKDDQSMASLIVSGFHLPLLEYARNVLATQYINEKQNIKHYRFIDVIDENHQDKFNYLTASNLNYESHHDVLTVDQSSVINANNIDFIEYPKHLGNKTIKINFVAADNYISLEPEYNNQFGLSSANTKRAKLMLYLCRIYNFNLIDFQNMITSENVDGYVLEFNWDNSVSVTVPTDVYLSIKDAQELTEIF